jgi:hypothetical protein
MPEEPGRLKRRGEAPPFDLGSSGRTGHRMGTPAICFVCLENVCWHYQGSPIDEKVIHLFSGR